MNESPKEKSAFLKNFEQKNPTLYFILDLFFNILVIVVLVYGIRTYLISPFQVYGPSMCDTLNFLRGRCQDGFGEYLIVNKAVYYPFMGRRFSQPQRGDIIVFKPPHDNEDFYIKRIIGLPGEKIKLQNGKVVLFNEQYQSGYTLPEEYLNEDNKNQTFPLPSSQIVTTYEVPENMYFVLGDNRKHSTDSRTCFKGVGDRECTSTSSQHFLSLNRIEGKAWVILWPFNKLRALSDPAYESSPAS